VRDHVAWYTARTDGFGECRGLSRPEGPPAGLVLFPQNVSARRYVDGMNSADVYPAVAPPASSGQAPGPEDGPMPGDPCPTCGSTIRSTERSSLDEVIRMLPCGCAV
jgi:hypothetical protein